MYGCRGDSVFTVRGIMKPGGLRAAPAATGDPRTSMRRRRCPGAGGSSTDRYCRGRRQFLKARREIGRTSLGSGFQVETAVPVGPAVRNRPRKCTRCCSGLPAVSALFIGMFLDPQDVRDRGHGSGGRRSESVRAPGSDARPRSRRAVLVEKRAGGTGRGTLRRAFCSASGSAQRWRDTSRDAHRKSRRRAVTG